MSVKFTQSCPTCGRRIRIRASLLGYTVACQHCRAEFVAHSDFEPAQGPDVGHGSDLERGTASGTEPASHAGSASLDPLMQRVEKLLSNPSTL